MSSEDLRQSNVEFDEVYDEMDAGSEPEIIIPVQEATTTDSVAATGKKTKQKRKPSSKPPSEKQLAARRNFTILARARLNFMNENVDENGKRHKPEKGWKPTAEQLAFAEEQLITEGKLN